MQHKASVDKFKTELSNWRNLFLEDLETLANASEQVFGDKARDSIEKWIKFKQNPLKNQKWSTLVFHSSNKKRKERGISLYEVINRIATNLVILNALPKVWENIKQAGGCTEIAIHFGNSSSHHSCDVMAFNSTHQIVFLGEATNCSDDFFPQKKKKSLEDISDVYEHYHETGKIGTGFISAFLYNKQREQALPEDSNLIGSGNLTFAVNIIAVDGASPTWTIKSK